MFVKALTDPQKRNGRRYEVRKGQRRLTEWTARTGNVERFLVASSCRYASRLVRLLVLIKVHHRHYFGMCLFCSRCMPTMQKIIRVCFVIASWTSLPEAKILSTLQAAQGETFQKWELEGGQQALISETSRFFRLPAKTVSSLERLRPYL